jgi:hypothetical protein
MRQTTKSAAVGVAIGAAPPLVFFVLLPRSALGSNAAAVFFPFIYPGFLAAFLVFGGHGDGGNWFQVIAIVANAFFWGLFAFVVVRLWNRRNRTREQSSISVHPR